MNEYIIIDSSYAGIYDDPDLFKHRRFNLDETKVVYHINHAKEIFPFPITLDEDGTEHINFTYPTYNDSEIRKVMESGEWSNKDVI